MRKIVYLTVAILIFFLHTAWAQGNPDDPFAASFFPPELLMQYQKDIGVSPTQRQSLLKEIQAAQTIFTEKQWSLEAEMDSFLSMIQKEKIKESEALLQMEKVLTLENEIKRAQLTLMIRLKNLLTPEQQRKLKDLKK